MMKKYFIAVIPPAELSGQITDLRRKYLPGLNEKDEHKKFPHITLQHTFSRTENVESELSMHLSRLATSFTSFPVKLSGIGHFDSRIIYVQVENNPELDRLHKEMKKNLIEKMNFSEREVSPEFKPHITLEKKIKREDFSTYWKNITEVKFSVDFMARSFSLMRHTGIKWNEISTYFF